MSGVTVDLSGKRIADLRNWLNEILVKVETFQSFAGKLNDLLPLYTGILRICSTEVDVAHFAVDFLDRNNYIDDLYIELKQRDSAGQNKFDKYMLAANHALKDDSLKVNNVAASAATAATAADAATAAGTAATAASATSATAATAAGTVESFLVPCIACVF